MSGYRSGERASSETKLGEDDHDMFFNSDEYLSSLTFKWAFMLTEQGRSL